jgi:hypothetical protein
MKRLGIVQARLTAREYARKGQERVMARSFRWPVTRK